MSARLGEGGETLFMFASVVVMLALAMGAGWWRAGQKADAYYRATGVRVDQWDAMFLDLRVDGAPKSEAGK